MSKQLQQQADLVTAGLIPDQVSFSLKGFKDEPRLGSRYMSKTESTANLASVEENKLKEQFDELTEQIQKIKVNDEAPCMMDFCLLGEHVEGAEMITHKLCKKQFHKLCLIDRLDVEALCPNCLKSYTIFETLNSEDC